jgi:pimeloyl-ACP methyl ester carboxylesterase
MLVVSEESHAFFAEAAARLAKPLGIDVARTPGTHFPYLDHPEELAQTVRPFLGRVSL